MCVRIPVPAFFSDFYEVGLSSTLSSRRNNDKKIAPHVRGMDFLFRCFLSSFLLRSEAMRIVFLICFVSLVRSFIYLCHICTATIAEGVWVVFVLDFKVNVISSECTLHRQDNLQDETSEMTRVSWLLLFSVRFYTSLTQCIENQHGSRSIAPSPSILCLPREIPSRGSEFSLYAYFSMTSFSLVVFIFSRFASDENSLTFDQFNFITKFSSIQFYSLHTT